MNTRQLAEFSTGWMATVGELETAAAIAADVGRAACGDTTREQQARGEQDRLLRKLVGYLASADPADRPEVTRLILAARVVTRLRPVPAAVGAV